MRYESSTQQRLERVRFLLRKDETLDRRNISSSPLLSSSRMLINGLSKTCEHEGIKGESGEDKFAIPCRLRKRSLTGSGNLSWP